jgi:hypothetical protein
MARTDQVFRDGFTISPSDTVNFPTRADGVFVGGAGNVVLITESNRTLTFVGLPAASLIPVSALRVNNTNTTATNLVGLTYQPAYDAEDIQISSSVEIEIVDRAGATINDRANNDIWARS